jgi:hypothetical protein
LFNEQEVEKFANMPIEELYEIVAVKNFGIQHPTLQAARDGLKKWSEITFVFPDKICNQPVVRAYLENRSGLSDVLEHIMSHFLQSGNQDEILPLVILFIREQLRDLCSPHF